MVAFTILIAGFFTGLMIPFLMYGAIYAGLHGAEYLWRYTKGG